MASKELNVKVKHRYDTASNWTTNNPVLLAGELGIESDTRKMKVGNGTSTWSQLGYQTPNLPSSVAHTNKSNTFGYTQYFAENASISFARENASIKAWVGKTDPTGEALIPVGYVFFVNNTDGIIEIGGNQMPIKASGLTDGVTTKSMSEILAGGGLMIRRWTD